MKLKAIALIVLLSSLCSLFAADAPKPSPDPFDGAFFPPELVMIAGGQIGLTQEQQDGFRARVEKAQLRSEELRKKLESETAALSALAKKDRVDEAALLAQLDKVLDAEREVKRLHLGLLAAIKNLLTPEQQAKLRDIAKSGGAQLKEEVGKRLTEKVQRIHEAAQKWADSGRDPSEIAQAMEEKVKPLIEGGKPLEAEAEIDRLLERLAKEAK